MNEVKSTLLTLSLRILSGRRLLPFCMFVLIFCLSWCISVAQAERNTSLIRFNATTSVFRIDAGDTSYVLGINEHQQVQTLYWGKRLPASDNFPAARAISSPASFDLPITTTPQEFVGWGEDYLSSLT